MELDERRRLRFSEEQLQDEVWGDITSNIVLEDTYNSSASLVRDRRRIPGNAVWQPRLTLHETGLLQ